MTILEIELIGEDVRQLNKAYERIGNLVSPGLGTEICGKVPPSGWVAEITGYDTTYKYARNFLKCKKDYSRANSIRSRGVYAEYILESGKIYEVKQSSERYFCIIDDDGNILAELFSDAEFSEAWEGEGDER